MSIQEQVRNGNHAGSSVLTEDAPEFGRVHIFEVTVSEGERWIEDGVHIIRSTEFELLGQGDSVGEAVEDFIGHAVDYHMYLARLVQENDATEHEARVLGELSRRFVEAYEESRKDSERRDSRLFTLTLNLGRRHSRQRPQHWHPSPRNISSTLSHA